MHNDQPRRVAIVTGASSGIGKSAAKALVAQGWRVIGVGRNPERCQSAEAEIGGLPDAEFTMLRADLSSLSETARIAQEIARIAPRIDALLNNAGGVLPKQIVTQEGFEATFAANHLSPFYLTRQLLPILLSTASPSSEAKARVINVSSAAHEYCPNMNWNDLNLTKNFSTGGAYCQAKLASLLFTRELAHRFGNQGIVAHAMHPGVVDSNFWSHGDEGFKARIASIRDTALSPDQAADTLIWLASAAEPEGVNGRYYENRVEIPPSVAAQDDDAAKRLWDVCEALVTGH